MRDPFEVLGLPTDAPMHAVRARYFLLARQHHPDKLSALSAEDRAASEDFFKRVTAAYASIAQGSVNTPVDEWRCMWDRVKTTLQQPAEWKHVLHETVVDVVSKLRRRHTFTVPITLEDVVLRKTKRVQLQLASGEQLVTSVACDSFPASPPALQHDIDGVPHVIAVKFAMAPHPRFSVDVQDLVVRTHMPVTWRDFIAGKVFRLDWLDGTSWSVELPPFFDATQPVPVTNWGVWQVQLVPEWQVPSADAWARLPTQKRDLLHAILSELGAFQQQ